MSEDEKIGYKKPPSATRFKQDKSGNPKDDPGERKILRPT